jgi:hypothetical protein
MMSLHPSTLQLCTHKIVIYSDSEKEKEKETEYESERESDDGW